MPYLNSTEATVLITGANGYIGAWTVKTALERGLIVRAVVRSTQRVGPTAETIRPAVDGTLGLLKSAVQNGENIKRIVITSSTAAIATQQTEPRTFSEADWNESAEAQSKDVSDPFFPYRASKTFCRARSLIRSSTRKGFYVASLIKIFKRPPTSPQMSSLSFQTLYPHPSLLVNLGNSPMGEVLSDLNQSLGKMRQQPFNLQVISAPNPAMNPSAKLENIAINSILKVIKTDLHRVQQLNVQAHFRTSLKDVADLVYPSARGLGGTLGLYFMVDDTVQG
ncbi:hypothetical protein NMY22_g12784 [Coprinellus aureogranulatus]|nr:hypothetical protein NMY22_g12784 [Coprinellus aureogranulatus]